MMEKHSLEEYEKLVKESFANASKMANKLETSDYLKGKATVVIFEKMLPKYVRVKKE